MNEDPLPTEVTIDQGNLIRGVIKSWDKNLLNVNYLMHDNWVGAAPSSRTRPSPGGTAGSSGVFDASLSSPSPDHVGPEPGT